MNWTLRRSAAALLLGILFACDTAVWAQTTPTLQGTASRKAHGAAGTFDLPLGGNAAPVVHNDTGSTAPGVAIQINVLSNDTDPDHDPLSVVAFSQGGNGSVACLAISDGTNWKQIAIGANAI